MTLLLKVKDEFLCKITPENWSISIEAEKSQNVEAEWCILVRQNQRKVVPVLNFCSKRSDRD
jgi:hypothetical protein